MPAKQPYKLRFVLTGMLALLSMGNTASVAAETFHNPYRIPTALDPATIVIGDFNGDGLPDIGWVDTSTTPDTLHILLAQTGGGYTAAPSITFPLAATYPEECLAADFNHDGRLDLVCTSTNGVLANNVAVYFGNGDGTFQAPVVTAVSTGTTGQSYTPMIYLAGDINGDGLPDLIEIQYGGGAIVALLGNGKGGFTTVQQTFSLDVSPVTVADVNGDGKPDLLTNVGPFVYLGNGDGTFTPEPNSSSPVYSADYPYCVFHDMDGDGHLDAVCANQNLSDSYSPTAVPHLYILHGNPNGTFNSTPLATQNFGIPYEGGTFEYPLAIYDANGDGIPDMLAESGDGISMHLGLPNNVFDYPSHYATGTMPYDTDLVNLTSVTTNSTLVTSSMYQFALTDMNGDGFPDIVSTGSHGIYISYGAKDGTFATAPAYQVTSALSSMSLADFNGDGIPDIAAADGRIELSLGKGDGSFHPYTSLPNTTSTGTFYNNGSGIMHGDFNGDGKQDILAFESYYFTNYQYLFLYFGHGDGTFDAPLQVTSTCGGIRISDDAGMDINNDGRTDIVYFLATISLNPTIFACLSNGDGTFTDVGTPAQADPSPDPTYSGAVYLPSAGSYADFNHDGKLDLAYGSVNNVYVVLGNGDGTFATSGPVLPIPPVNGNIHSIAVASVTADFDGDGNQDIAVLVQYETKSATAGGVPAFSAVWVYYGDGHGNFSAAVSAGIFDRPYQAMTTADFNRDGLTDIALSYHVLGVSNTGDSVAVIHAQAGRTFSAETDYTGGPGAGAFNSIDEYFNGYATKLVAIDMNNDGYPDLVAANGYADLAVGGMVTTNSLGNSLGNSVTVLLNSATDTVATATETTLTSSLNPSVFSDPITFTATVTSLKGAPKGTVTFTDTPENSIGPSVTLGTVTVDNSGVAKLTTSTLVDGSHIITATFDPTGNFASSKDSLIQVVTGYPTTATLTVSPNPADTGQNVTATAVIAPVPPATGTPTGTVTFYYGTTVLGIVPLSNGFATFSTFTLPAGKDKITCTYSGDANFAPSTCNTVTETILDTATTITLTSDHNPSYTYEKVNFTVKTTSQGKVPLTPITLTANGKLLTTLLPTTETTKYKTAFDTPGTYTIVATFAGNTTQAASSATLSQVVILRPSTVYLAVSPTKALVGTAVTLSAATLGLKPTNHPGGDITFYDGTTALATIHVKAGVGTGSFTTSTLAAGTHSLTCTYTGNKRYAGSDCNTVPIVIYPPPVITLTASPNPVFLYNPVAISASVSSSYATPTGTLTFLDGTTPLGTVTLASAATGTSSAAISTSALALGTHSITASYSGDTNFAAAVSAPVTVIVEDFALTIANTPLTIHHGGTAVFNLSLNAVGGPMLASPITLTVSGNPDHAPVTFSPATVPATGSSATATLTIATPDYPVGPWSSMHKPAYFRARNTSLALLALGGLLLPFTRRPRRRLQRLTTVLLFVAASLLLGSASGCGSGWGDQSYHITVTAASGNLSHTATAILVTEP